MNPVHKAGCVTERERLRANVEVVELSAFSVDHRVVCRLCNHHDSGLSCLVRLVMYSYYRCGVMKRRWFLSICISHTDDNAPGVRELPHSSNMFAALISPALKLAASLPGSTC